MFKSQSVSRLQSEDGSTDFVFHDLSWLVPSIIAYIASIYLAYHPLAFSPLLYVKYNVSGWILKLLIVYCSACTEEERAVAVIFSPPAKIDRCKRPDENNTYDTYCTALHPLFARVVGRYVIFHSTCVCVCCCCSLLIG